MKTQIFLFAFLFALRLSAQSDFEKTYFSRPYTDTFKNESVVMARVMEEYTYTPLGQFDYKVSVVYRAQYILKDISALNSFSTLSKNKELKRYELKQIKASGKVNTIYEYFDKNYPEDGYDKKDDNSETEKEEEEIPLEELEIGDIIDYKYEYTYTTKTRNFKKVTLNNGKFDGVQADIPNHHPYKYLLFKNKFIENNYPAASGVLVIHAPADLSLVYKAVNGNYTFSRSENGRLQTHSCYLDNIPSFKAEEYSYYYLHHPVIKYALVQNDQSKTAYYPFQFAEGAATRKDIAALGGRMFRDKKYISRYLYYLNTSKSGEAYRDVALKDFFKAFEKTFLKKVKDKYERLNKLHEYLCNEDELNEKHYGEIAYAVILARYCERLGIPFEMLAGLHRYDGKWEEVISPYEITWGLYLPRKQGDLFITSYEEESNIYQRFGSLSGTELLLFDPRREEAGFRTLVYPFIPSEENVYVQHSEISLSDDKEFDYIFVNEYSMKGRQKMAISDRIINQFSHERLRTPAPFFGLVNYGELYNFKEFSSNEEWFKEAKRIDSSYTLYYKDYYKQMMLGFLYDEYRFKNILIDSMRIYEDGTFKDDESQPYGFKVVFRARGLLEKMSSDSLMILHLGRLLTEQYHLPAYNVERRLTDVYNSNMKEIRWVNSIALPAGYTCVNLDDFSTEFENGAGKFKTTATLQDGKIHFSIEKIYKTLYLPKEQWMEMVGFMHAAESMFMKKLLLRKI